MKKLCSLFLSFVLLAGMLVMPSAAWSQNGKNTADALYQLHLFLGTGETYALDDSLTREQGITLLVRMLGAEKEATAGTWSHPFTDVSTWADAFVGYCYEKGITNGTGPDTFSGTIPMTDQMFLTLCLRAVGYTDGGENADFSYDAVWDFAKTVNLIAAAERDNNFTREDAVLIFWTLLNLPLKDGSATLAASLQAKDVFSADEWSKAVSVQKNGISASDPTGEKQSNGGSSGSSGSSGSGGGNGGNGGGSRDKGDISSGENELEIDVWGQ